MRSARVLGVKLFKRLFPESSVDSFCEQWVKYTRKVRCPGACELGTCGDELLPA
uniref:Uncharacterized protein n=1 Tax=Hyaloperonospora arabidopsidis (strain Emoy2) TaxID=559515 RepID=M4C1M7_HYAAE